MTQTRPVKKAARKKAAAAPARKKAAEPKPVLHSMLTEVSADNQKAIADWIMARPDLCSEGKRDAIKDLGLPQPPATVSVEISITVPLKPTDHAGARGARLTAAVRARIGSEIATKFGVNKDDVEVGWYVES